MVKKKEGEAIREFNDYLKWVEKSGTTDVGKYLQSTYVNGSRSNSKKEPRLSDRKLAKSLGIDLQALKALQSYMRYYWGDEKNLGGDPEAYKVFWNYVHPSQQLGVDELFPEEVAARKALVEKGMESFNLERYEKARKDFLSAGRMDFVRKAYIREIDDSARHGRYEKAAELYGALSQVEEKPNSKKEYVREGLEMIGKARERFGGKSKPDAVRRLDAIEGELIRLQSPLTRKKSLNRMVEAGSLVAGILSMLFAIVLISRSITGYVLLNYTENTTNLIGVTFLILGIFLLGFYLRNRVKINKRGIELEMLGWWILGLVVLVIVVIGIVILKGKGVGALEFIKNIFRFGGS